MATLNYLTWILFDNFITSTLFCYFLHCVLTWCAFCWQVDHLARAMRQVEIPMLKAKYEEHLVEDKKFWEEQEDERVITKNMLCRLNHHYHHHPGPLCIEDCWHTPLTKSLHFFLSTVILVISIKLLPVYICMLAFHPILGLPRFLFIGTL